MKLWFRLVVAASIAALPLSAQPTSKKALTQDTYDIWRNIQGATLSPDGQWSVYTLSPVVGDGEVIVRSTEGTTEHRVPRGWTGRPVNTVAQDSAFTAPAAQFTADSRSVVFVGYAPKSDFDRVRRERRRPADQPRNSLNIVNVADGKVTTIPRVRSFRLARESARVLVYLLESDDPPRDSSGVRAPADDSATPRPRRREYGSTLVIRDLATGAEERVADVVAYMLDDSAKVVLWAVASRQIENDGVYVRTLADGKTTALMKGQGDYRALALDRAGTQIAFVSNRDEFHQKKSRFTLYHATLKASVVQAIAMAGSIDSMSPSDNAGVSFVRNGSAILFGITPLPADSIPADSLADKAVFDLWHWKDPRLQPQQRIDAGRDRVRSFAAVYTIKAKQVLRLANDTIPQATVSDDGRFALSNSGVRYAVEAMWGDGGVDVILTDIQNGKRTVVAPRIEFGAQLSPGAKYVVYWNEGRYHAYATATGKRTDPTGALKGVRFDQETWDAPSTPAPWGLGGWTRDDASVLIYDRYDIWEIDPAGVRPPRMVTDSLGTQQRLVLRVTDLDPDDRFIDPSAPLLLNAFDEETKASGFYSDRLGTSAAPERIVMADRRFGTPSKARQGDRLLVTQSTIAEPPDLWTGASLASLARISNANPQQAEYRWPTVELVSWLSADGIPLKGLLYKPEGFDPSKKYPMVVYYYESLSDGLHTYVAPAGRNVVNATVYTSHGYLVFFPDIAYEVGWPGPSAVKSIIPGVHSLVARGFVNPKAIGVAGQSWGGYQTSYLITQTSMFAAAVPNATVVNMTSAYGGIRWESGAARPFQYEKTQSRIGGSLWEFPVRYIENSPLFHLDRVTTPVLAMANDGDGAVPWYQGIEYYVAMRRLGKEIYLVNYNGDGHNRESAPIRKTSTCACCSSSGTTSRARPSQTGWRRGFRTCRKGATS